MSPGPRKNDKTSQGDTLTFMSMGDERDSHDKDN
jgi:hypothetical protein